MKGYELLLRELRKIQKEWKVRDLMTTAVKTISQDASMSEAIKDMKRYGIHGLIVTDDKTPVGIVTTYDALLIMARGMRGETTFVKDAMSKELISIHPDEDILDTLELMLDNQLTKLPVIDGRELVGILCATDLVDAFDRFLEENPIDVGEYPEVSLTVRDVMHEPTLIGPELLVVDAAKIMAEKGISSVLIKKEDTLGILTEKDMSKKVIARGFDGKNIVVSEIMSSPCYTIESDVSINDASELFNKHNIRRLPVVEHGEVVGMVSARDIAKTLTMRRRL